MSPHYLRVSHTHCSEIPAPRNAAVHEPTRSAGAVLWVEAGSKAGYKDRLLHRPGTAPNAAAGIVLAEPASLTETLKYQRSHAD